MSQEDQGKKISPVVSDAAVKEVIPAKPTGELSELDLDNVAGGADRQSKDVVKLNCVNDKLK
jgi:hypothetical protein